MGELIVNLDFESRATVDLKKSGAYPYAEHEQTALWCAAFAIDGNADDVRIWTPDNDYGHNDDLRHAIREGASIRAWNAAFERVMWANHMATRFGFRPLPIERFYCTAADAAACALPRALDNAGRVLRTLTQKDGEGKKLMLKMAKPRNAAAMKKDPAVRPIWWDDAGMRRALESYCAQDVRAEIAVAQRIRQITPAERKIYVLDQRINDRGVKLDTGLASALADMADEATRRANESVREISEGRVAGVTKLRDMLAFVTSLGVETAKLDKQAVSAILDDLDTPTAARQILELRREAAKTSVRKVGAMFACASRDSRMRGAMLYHGAGTGRFSHKLYQPGNLPSRTKLTGYKPEQWIQTVVGRQFDALDLMYPVLEALAMLLRSCLVAGEGKRFIGADFNAIEARVLAWLAGETWILDAFRNGTDLYRLMAADIYGVPVEVIGKPSPERDMGKRAVLGCGFQMGHLKFIATCLREAGVVIDEPFGRRVVATYREKAAAIVAFWYELERCAVEAVRNPGRKVYAAEGKLAFVVRGEFLNIILPNRTRALAYYRPTVRDKLTPWGAYKPCVSFWGENSKRQWVQIDLYGGLIAENVTQAVARDFMCDAMLRLEAAGYSIVLTVHDEILAEVPAGFGSVDAFEKIMCDLPAGYWGEGCPITAEGWTGPRFKK
ncbi:DNA polymerase [Paraburkholderia sp. RL18-103-BIB-C]|uniref:DNA polymerase n=1 Tax=Paraburkholderia sp. RL18-103-BIB-C TaxID=3031637 RepID=UPI0038BA8F92